MIPDFIEITNFKYSFFLAKYITTYKCLSIVTNITKNGSNQSNHPVTGLYFDNCIDYCNKLEEHLNSLNHISEDYYVDIPRIDEWVHAYDKKENNRWFFGNDPNHFSKYAWYEKNSKNNTHEVGLKKPNSIGLYDLHGNVFEWCHHPGSNKYNYKETDESVFPAIGGAYDSLLDECDLNEHNYIGGTNQFNESVGFRIGLFPKKHR